MIVSGTVSVWHNSLPPGVTDVRATLRSCAALASVALAMPPPCVLARLHR